MALRAVGLKTEVITVEERLGVPVSYNLYSNFYQYSTQVLIEDGRYKHVLSDQNDDVVFWTFLSPTTCDCGCIGDTYRWLILCYAQPRREIH